MTENGFIKVFHSKQKELFGMRRKNLRKVIAGVMALTMVALAMGVVSVSGTGSCSVVSAAVISETEQNELTELRDELISDLELFEDGLSGLNGEIGNIVSSGRVAIENADSIDELETVWQNIKNEISALEF